MKIQWAIPCRYAEEHDGHLDMQGAGNDIFLPTTLPVTLGLYLALGIEVPHHELDHEEPIVVKVYDPDMRCMELATLWVRLRDYARRPDTWVPSILHVLPVEIDVRARGQYLLHLQLQDRMTPVSLFVLEP